MKIFSGLLIVCFLMLIFCIRSATANPTIIKVPADYSTIQQAINAAHDGDTIEVATGVFQENLYIDKTLTLKGNDRTTIINGRGSTVIEANDTSVSISGFKITNGTFGILLSHCQDCEVEKNSVDNCGTGIWLYGSDRNTVTGNTVLDCRSYGILLCGHSGEDLVRGNTMKGNGNGLGVSGPNSRIYHNNFINNKNQTLFIPSFPNTWDNTYEGNYWSDYTETNFDSHGIGNSPYVVEQSVTLWNIDHCPLRSPYVLGDVNHDAVVDIVDITVIAAAFDSGPSYPNWNPHADVDESGVIDILDITNAATQFGREWIEP